MESIGKSMMVDILNKYYKNQKDLKNLLKLSKDTKIEFKINEKDVSQNVMEFKKGDKVYHSAKYELLGYYILETKQWNWAWAMSKGLQSDTTTANKVLRYGLSIEQDDMINEILKESRFVISNRTAYDIFIAYIAYISKAKQIFNYPKDDIIQVFVLH